MCRLCPDEEWWSKIDFLLKFTGPAFELIRSMDIDQPFLGEVYDGMGCMVEKTMEIISEESPQLLLMLVLLIWCRKSCLTGGTISTLHCTL